MRQPEHSRAMIDRINDGDVAAFSELFTAFHARLCSYSEGYVGSPDTAKEIVSDLFLWIWEHREEWVVTGSVAAYLFRAVRNRSIDYLQHRRRAERVHSAALRLHRSPGMAQPGATPAQELDALELAQTVEQILEQLPERSREAFRLQREHGLSYAEIADVMGISVSTVEKHMIRALQALRAGLAAWTHPG